MQKCCIKGCDSHKYVGEKNISYFPFPLHDEILLKKWLTQINIPNWKPGARHRVCSVHFAIDDIENHPNTKQQFLNPLSIPTIFPERESKMSNDDKNESSITMTNRQSSLPLQVVNVGGNGNCDISVLRSMPVILIPMQIAGQNSAQFSLQNVMQMRYANRITEQIQCGEKNSLGTNLSSDESGKTTETFLRQQLIVQPRLRKILPKPDDFSESKNLDTIQKVIPSLPVAKSDIYAIPKIMNSDADESGKKILSRYPGNKRPVLKISINKRRNVEKSEKSPSTSNEKASNSFSDDMKTDDSMDEKNSLGKEITIENTSTNKIVTFRLDRKTGEIVATTKEMKKTTINEEDFEIERKVDDICGRTGTAKLRQLYTKSQRECNALRKRLKILRQRHKEEQEEIERLQEHLTRIGDRVQQTFYDDSIKIQSTKRKPAEKYVRSVQDDNCEESIEEPKKIKQDIRETIGLSTTTNEQQENSSRQNLSRLTNNSGYFDLNEDNKDNIIKIRKSDDEKINGKCNNFVRTMRENSIDLKSYSGIDEAICKEEFLDTEFLFE